MHQPTHPFPIRDPVALSVSRRCLRHSDFRLNVESIPIDFGAFTKLLIVYRMPKKFQGGEPQKKIQI